MSRKERLLRKKYMGLWSWGSERIRSRMRLFPKSVTTWDMRSRQRKVVWARGYGESLSRMKETSSELFCLPMSI